MVKNQKNKIKNQKSFVVTRKTIIADLISLDSKKLEKVYAILLGAGLGCVGCTAASFETIEQGCLMHGMNEKQIDMIIKKLNKSIAN